MKDYFSQYPYAELKSKDGKTNLKFCTYNYQFPNINQGYDADWHRNYLQFSTPGFKVKIDEPIFEGKVLNSFLKELKQFHALKIDKVHLYPTERYVLLEFSLNHLGSIIVIGSIQYPLGCGATLEFEFETDLTLLDIFIEGIKEILVYFPKR